MEATITTKKYRESGVEIFKIIAILLICISHAVQTASDFIPYSTPSLDIQMLTLHILRYSGMIGNTIFVVCSSYFLFDSSRTKWDKVFNLLLDSMFISISCLIGMLIGGYQLATKEIIKQIMPDLFAQVWFVPFYVMFYLSHPILNAAIQKLDKKSFLSLLIVLFFVFFVMTFVVSVPEVCKLIYAFVIYLFIGYFRKYHKEVCDSKKINILFFTIGFGLFLIISICKYFLGIKFSVFVNEPILNYAVSPFIGISAFGLLNLFRRLNLQSNFINYISSCSLFVYCIHENYLLRAYIRPKIYELFLDQYGPNQSIVWILLTGIVMFFGGIILSIFYKETLHKVTNRISKIFDKWLDLFTDKLNKKI